MCGICGAVGNVREGKQVITNMMKAIEHRGPDGGDCYVTKDIMLGFRRLSIIDHEAGMQPMFNEDKSKVLVFNGEIYNYMQLRSMLKEKGHKFQTASDSEVLVHGYEEFNKDILKKLYGMFSFAVWDEENQELFAARDYFGIKPFYYAVIDHTLVFASEIKSILEFPGYHREVNENALDQYLSFEYSVLSETFFKGIYKLMPGHYLTYKNQQLKVVRYFEPTLDPSLQKKQSQVIQEVRNTVYHSVQRHLVSDVEVGSFLSGGVDSSLLAAMSGVKQTFTVGFDKEGELYNETGHAKTLSDNLQVKNHCKYIEKEEFKEAVPNVMYHMDEPAGDASVVALYFLAKEASKKVKVVLSGEGSDEFFGGYNIYLEPKMCQCLNWIPKGIRKKMADGMKTRNMRGRNYFMRSIRPLSHWYIGNAYIFHEKEKEQLLKRRNGTGDPKTLLKEDYAKLKGLKDSDQMQSMDLKYWLPGDILQKADKMSMAHSLEVRVPFVDREVFQVARQIPHKIKTKHYTTKYVLRKAASSYLPKETSNRKKLGFPIPIRNWIKEDDWYGQIKKAFTGETASKYFHTKYLLKLLEEHRANREDNSKKIWTVYAFLVWHQVFFEGMKVQK